MVITLGNHDDRDNARKAMAKLAGENQAVVQKMVSVIDAGPCNLVLLDSLMITAISPGLLGSAQRKWLAGYLGENAGKPAVVFVHHNPDGESDGALLDADRLLAILRPQRHVKMLVFGHTHVFSLDKTDGLHLLNLPAVGYNFADGNPVGWMDAVFRSDGADLTLHAIAGEVRDDGRQEHLRWR